MFVLNNSILINQNDIKSINSDQYFFQYLKDEIDKSNQKIKNLLKHELEASDKYREGRTSLYLAHKEHIRYINELLKTKQTTCWPNVG
jgi:hypothetical protein